jgi:Fe-S cluster assembly iron-binding protein IscA
MKITEEAKRMLSGILDENPGKSLRIVFQGFGWGGPRLGLALDEPKEKDLKLHVNDVEVLMEEQVKPFTTGQVLDYLNSSAGSGFVIVPASGKACCWSSPDLIPKKRMGQVQNLSHSFFSASVFSGPIRIFPK